MTEYITDENVVKDLEKYLAKNSLYIDDMWIVDGYLKIHISWGDWKHDHARCDYLLKQLGYVCVNEWVTDEDGGDCYSSLHKYLKEV